MTRAALIIALVAAALAGAALTAALHKPAESVDPHMQRDVLQQRHQPPGSVSPPTAREPPVSRPRHRRERTLLRLASGIAIAVAVYGALAGLGWVVYEVTRCPPHRPTSSPGEAPRDDMERRA